jgi:hypothetical protein
VPLFLLPEKRFALTHLLFPKATMVSLSHLSFASINYPSYNVYSSLLLFVWKEREKERW